MITVDMTKAKVIAHDARRAARNAAFAPLDIKATIPAESEAAEASRATIRTTDAALQVSMDAASDAAALKALLPAIDQMWSSPVQLYPVFMPLPINGQAQVIEPQVSTRQNVERYSVVNVTGIDAYRQRPISQNVWVA